MDVKCCTISGCDSPVGAKGYCWKHYGRLRRNGDPLARGQHGGRRDEQSSLVVPDPAPLVTLRLELQLARGRDREFAAAWADAIAALPAEWADVLGEHRAVWRDAYYGSGERSFPELAADDEPGDPRRRPGPPLILSGQRHDGASALEPVEVPWCR